MKYKLINKQTGEETLCDKVTIDGFDYYVSDNPNINDVIVYNNTIGKLVFTQNDSGQGYDIEIGIGVSYPIYEPLNLVKKVIATNNPNINDIPNMVDDVDFAFDNYQKLPNEFKGGITQWTSGFHFGYNKSQETHPFSEEDMIEFYEWCDSSEEAGRFWRRNRVDLDMSGSHNKIIREKRKELLQLWKEQRIKTIYYQ